MVPVMIETGAGPVGSRPGFLHVLIEFKQILYDEHLFLAHLKGNGQVHVFQCYPGNQRQAFRLSYRVRSHTVSPLLGECVNQHQRPFIRGIAQIPLPEPFLHHHHKCRKVSAVLLPVISAVVMSAALRALAFREQHRLPVENDMYRK